MPYDSISELTNAFIAVMLQDLEMTTNEENFSEGHDAPDISLDQSDLDPGTRRRIARLCRDFYIANKEHIHTAGACKRGAAYSVVSWTGSDLYMTLAGHGVGFWDSTYWDNIHGGAMYEYVQEMGHFDGAYIGDNGKVYL